MCSTVTREYADKLAKATRESECLQEWFAHSEFVNKDPTEWWKRGGCYVVAAAFQRHLEEGEIWESGLHAVLRLPDFDLDGDGVRVSRLEGGQRVGAPEQAQGVSKDHFELAVATVLRELT